MTRANKKGRGPMGRVPGRAITSFAHPQELKEQERSMLSASSTENTELDRFEISMEFAQRLMLARGQREYRDDMQMTATILAFKAWNDLRAAVLVACAGYAAQAFPLLRAALEEGEILEYLQKNPDSLPEYLEERDRFGRHSLGWIREALPHTETRRLLYDRFNYQTHPNVRGIGIYSYEASASNPENQILVVGPMSLRDANLSPMPSATLLTNYATRFLAMMDPDAAIDSWLKDFQVWDAKGLFHESETA